ncbi:MAG: cobalt transporter CbiM [Candidatus Methanoperedens sp.]|nr:cobalt transporter CbiM [Candidatus Methanoperedens sp.]MCE8427817.1 cobalt transporter CbiM [Candidatus Methanoperedens sp.]
MHIPDGYLGPITWITLWLVMIPIWIIAARKLKKELRTRNVPLLAMGAAFSFVIMMFNVPVLGGSTGHAVGGTLIAIILGPWAALIAVSVALIIQALFFGDGGITAIGANCFNMGFVLPFIGYYIYRLITVNADITSSRRWKGAGIASYIAINVAAVLVGIEFGIQTILYPAVNGKFQYFMYPLSVSVPTMAIEHLLLFGFVEAIVTLLVVRYLQQTDPSLLRLSDRKIVQDKIPAGLSV